MSAFLVEGENQILILRGRHAGENTYKDLVITLEVEAVDPSVPEPVPAADSLSADPDGDVTTKAPQLGKWSREWYVALALGERWLTGADDYPRPASNRGRYEWILDLRGYASHLERSQRVDGDIRAVARLAF